LLSAERLSDGELGARNSRTRKENIAGKRMKGAVDRQYNGSKHDTKQLDLTRGTMAQNDGTRKLRGRTDDGQRKRDLANPHVPHEELAHNKRLK